MDGTTRAQQHRGAWVIELHGEHDASTTPTVAGHLEHAATTRRPVLVDLTTAEFIDTSIVAALVRILAVGDHQPRAAIVAPTGQPRRRLGLLGLDGQLGLYDTRTAAFTALGLST